MRATRVLNLHNLDSFVARSISGTRTHRSRPYTCMSNGKISFLISLAFYMKRKQRLEVSKSSSKYNKNCLNKLSWRQYASFSLISTAFASEDLQYGLQVPWVR